MLIMVALLGLGGNIEIDYEKYLQRSPIQYVNCINMPLILFHGLKDKVIPSDQSIAIKDELLRRGIPVQINLYSQEFHVLIIHL